MLVNIDLSPHHKTISLSPADFQCAGGIPLAVVSRRNLAGGLETFSHCPASSLAMSVSPLLADPYESRWVEVRQSTVRDGGDGLFARRDIPPDTVVSFYHGLVYRSQWRPS